MAPILIAIGVFIFGAGFVLAVSTGIARLPGMLVQRRVQSRMDDVARHLEPEQGTFSLVKQHVDGALPVVDRIASGTVAGSWLSRLIEQAGKKVGVSTVLLGSILSGLVVSILATGLLKEGWAFVPGFLLGMALPTLFLMHLRRRRIKSFEEKFPEALDLLSRAVKAGHAFTTAMGMVADDAQDPIGPEFKKAFDEQNFGLPLKDALNNMAIRMPLLDVKFFATAVLIQRETGGNLSEILDNLAHVVRERFKILRQVRVYTAHGRMTGYVLLALPAFLAIALMFINPEHMNTLFNERAGRMMIAATVVMQTIGYFWIRKVVTIEV
jgi:tight adherence protein B